LTRDRKAVKLPSLEHDVNHRPKVRGPVVPPPEHRILLRPVHHAWPGLRRLAPGIVALLIAPAPFRSAGAQEPDRVVRQLKFEGNKAIPKTTLAAAIGTTNSSWFATSPLVRWIHLGAKRYFSETEFRRDVLRLEVLYKRSGFPDVAVDTAVRRTDKDAYVTFRIHEGRPIRISKVTIRGVDSLRERAQGRLVLDLPLREGDVFNRYVMQVSADTLTTRLKNHGYPEAAVYTSFESSRTDYTASVSFDVDPGRRARFGQVRVIGVERLDSSVVPNLLVARTGRPYSRDLLFESQRNLYKSDLVRSATVGIDSTHYTPGNDTVPVLVRLTESRPFRLRTGLGYATTECFRSQAAFTVRDFFGQGRVFELSGNVSRIGVGRPFDFGLDKNICSVSQEDSIGSSRFNYQLSATIRRPAFVSPNNTLSLTAFAERRSEFKVYLRSDIGATVEIMHETPRRRFPLSLSYTISYGRTEATAASFCAFFNACTPDVIAQLEERRLLAALTAQITVPRANSPIEPTRGYNASLEVTNASKILGSSELEQFTRILADAAWYRQLTRGVVFSWHVRGGVIFSPRVALGTQTNAFVPPEQRFYAGGPNDVRGFRRNELGPVVYVVRDSTLMNAGSPGALSPDSVQVAPTGGNSLVVGNVELRFPSPILATRMRLAAFVDGGMLWERGRPDLAPATLRITPGFGLRIATPLGPARLDLAYNPYSLLRGTLFQTDAAGNLTTVQDNFAVDRRSRIFGVPITVQFSVGQPF
jgi:outer membrane protein insertion porin family